MATFVYNSAAYRLVSGDWNLTTLSSGGKLKVLLVNDGYTPNKDHTVVDPGTNNAADASYNELDCTNYDPGFAGTSRKAVTATFQVDNTNDRAVIALSQPQWLELGGATNDIVRGAILYVEGTSDTDSRLFAFFDLPGSGSGYTTNGSDFSLQFVSLGSGGNIRLNC